ncbi:MAG: monovalent cation/hydrogen antiporter [Pseudonocardiales bacterium]|jgi:Na+/H+ antiporter|nr:monovalent cation/hydrogen antiporter [Pseudonocardiales bacterium]
MEVAFEVIGLILVVAVVRAAARRVGLPEPVLLLLVGVGLAYVPGFPTYRLPPEVMLQVVLPLLLYAAAFTAWLPALRANARPIALMAVGYTLFTTVVVGYLAHLVIPGLPLAAGMVLGALVAPPDAVAAVAVAREVGMPRRVVTILEGESLFNDAAALTALKVAVAAVVGESFGVVDAVGRFALASAGGLVVGCCVAWLLAKVRARIENPMSDATLSLLAPFLAYLPANAIGASGLVSVVVTGLYLGHQAPRLTGAQSRVVAQSLWQVIEYVLVGVVFVLIGLRLPEIVAGLNRYSAGFLAFASVAVVAAVVISRFVWVFPAAYLPPLLSRRVRERDPAPPWQLPALVSWAGMRGVVSLAAALSLPTTTATGAPFPQRELLLFLTFVVIVATLLGQGLALPAVVRRIRPPPDDDTAHTVQEAIAQRAVAAAGLQRLDEILERENPPPEVVEQLREQAERRLALAGAGGTCPDTEPAAVAYRRLRRQMLDAARARLIELRDRGELDQDAFLHVLRELDLEEASLVHDDRGPRVTRGTRTARSQR